MFEVYFVKIGPNFVGSPFQNITKNPLKLFSQKSTGFCNPERETP